MHTGHKRKQICAHAMRKRKKLQYIMLLCGVICSFARPFTRFSFWLNGKCFIAMRHKLNFPNCLSLSACNFTGKAGQLYFVFTMSIAKLLISPFLYILYEFDLVAATQLVLVCILWVGWDKPMSSGAHIRKYIKPIHPHIHCPYANSTAQTHTMQSSMYDTEICAAWFFRAIKVRFSTLKLPDVVSFTEQRGIKIRPIFTLCKETKKME